MTSHPHLRRILRPAIIALLLSAATMMVAVQPAFMHRAQARPSMNAPRQAPAQRPKQEHLGQWMERHSNMPLADQQRALENEPGFRDLPPQTQQAMRDRLTQLNNMPPEQRRRMIEHTEVMERLTPQQRQQFRAATEQYRSLPEDRRRLVARAFRDLREMPVPQRQAILNSDHFRSQFSDQERGTLSNLLSVEPYLPVEHPNDGPAVGKQ
ncbi:MAG: DUF3106 domain-containing protein [Edaphobacter sp.]